MGSWLSSCIGSGRGGVDEATRLTGGGGIPTASQQLLLDAVASAKAAQRAAAADLGGYASARALVHALVVLPDEVFRAGLLQRGACVAEALRCVDQALTVEAYRTSGLKSDRSVDLSVDRAALLWLDGRHDESLQDLRLAYKASHSRDVLRVWCERLRSLHRENDVHAICKEFYPAAASQDEREFYFALFFEYTTLSEKAMYEWAGADARAWIEAHGDAGIERGSVSRRGGGAFAAKAARPAAEDSSNPPPPPSLELPPSRA